ncbi:MAG: hypothetical protein ABR929_06355 [Roseiarcus sp.]
MESSINMHSPFKTAIRFCVWGGRLLLVTCGIFFAQRTSAFELDGFYSGMLPGVAQEKIMSLGLQSGGKLWPNEITAGPYSLDFCNKNVLQAMSKQLDVNEFNHYLLHLLQTYGSPKVDFAKPELDILYLRWTTADGTYSLNSGVQEGRRFHLISVLDERVCN